MRRLLRNIAAICRAQFFLFPALNTGLVRFHGKVRLRGHRSNLNLGPRVVFLGDATLVCESTPGGDFIELGANTVVEHEAFLHAHGGSIRTDRGVFIGVRTVIQGKGGVKIGEQSMLGPNVQIYSSDHGTDLSIGTYRHQPEITSPIQIGANVWIGASAIVLKGSSIDDHSIVAAAAVVRLTTDGPSFIRARSGLAEVHHLISVPSTGRA